MNRNLAYSIELGQMLEEYVYSSIHQDALMELMIKVFGLRNRNQLAQIFCGYDTPSSNLIFELLRKIGCPQLVQKYLNLNSVGLYAITTTSDTDLSKHTNQPPMVGQKSSGDGQDGSSVLSNELYNQAASRGDSETDSNFWGELDLSDFDSELFEN